MLPGGWVGVPVGDYKPSHLHEHPNLKVIGAPKVSFNQSDGKDLCASKSLALALYSIGFTKDARTVLPSWIVIQSTKQHFDWRQELDKRQMLLGVLHASDGSCCHAVTIHGEFMYDANETMIALLLCDKC
jgi:hypothetical protein